MPLCVQSLLTLTLTNMDRFGLLSHHHHHKNQVQDGEEKEESTVLVLDPSIAFLYCFFLLAIVLAAICFNLRRRSNLTVDLRLVQVKLKTYKNITVFGSRLFFIAHSSFSDRSSPWYILLPPPT